MGCYPHKSTKEANSIIKHSELNTGPNLNEKVMIPRKSRSREPSIVASRKHKERVLSARLTGKRCASPPSSHDDFWGTMPITVIIDRLFKLNEEINKTKCNYLETVEYIRSILNDLSNNFEKSSFKIIKKHNPTFKNLIGKYIQGIPFMKTLGFRDQED